MSRKSKNNNEPSNSLLKNNSTRLRFSVYVIIANFIAGIIGMVLGTDLTALGVFLSLSNTPLYVYVLGRTLRASSIPDDYYKQPHSGSGGLGTILNNDEYDYYNQGYNDYDYRYPTRDDYNIPFDIAERTENPKNPNIIEKNYDEIG